MKKTLLGLAAVLLALAMLAGCGKDPASQSAEPTPEPAATAAPAPTEAPTPTPVPVIGDYPELAAALDACAGYGQAEAGVSLKSVAAAAGLLEWSEAHAEDVDQDTLAVLVADWLSGLDELETEKFWGNWTQLEGLGRRLIEDPDSLAGEMESAGVTLSQTSYSLDKFTLLCNAVNRSTGK